MLRQFCLLLITLCLCFASYCQENYYIVKRDDSSGKIAKQYGINYDEFKRWNNLKGDNPTIHIGDTLWIVDPTTIQNKSNEVATIEVKSIVGNEVGAGVENGTPKGENPEKTQSHSWVWMLLGLLVGLVLGAALFYVLFMKKLKAELEHKENELSNLKFNLSNEKSNSNAGLSRLHSKIQSLERENQRLFDENVSLGEEIDHLKEIQTCENESSAVSSSQVPQQSLGASKTMFADAIIDGCFVKVREAPNEDSIFELHLDGENSVIFCIYKPAYQRVMANPSFLEGCEKQIIGDVMQIEIVANGTAQRDVSNGKWKIINKLNVLIK